MVPESEQILRRELGPGERLLWCAMPRQGLRFQRSDLFMIPFTMLWGGFAIFWEISVIRSNAPFFFCLWGIPFVLVGLYIMIGRFFADSRRRAHTHYGITGHRVLIVRTTSGRDVKSIPVQNLSEVSLQEGSDESGTIVFGPMNASQAALSGSGWPGSGRHMPPTFDCIEDARRVYNIITKLQRGEETGP